MGNEQLRQAPLRSNFDLIDKSGLPGACHHPELSDEAMKKIIAEVRLTLLKMGYARQDIELSLPKTITL